MCGGDQGPHTLYMIPVHSPEYDKQGQNGAQG